jgi:hypothetical protein
MALDARFEEAPDADAAFKAVDTNSVAVAGAVDAVYPGKKDQFLGLWRKHIDYYVDYVDAVKSEDEDAKAQAKQNLTNAANDLTNFFASANPKLNKTDLKNALAMHGDQTLSIIDKMSSHDFDAAYSTSHEAYEHMGSIADMLVTGIVTQMPSKY